VEDLEIKLQEILDELNKSFSVTIEDKGEDEIVTKVVLSELKNDGSMFLEKFIGLFSPLVEQLTEGQKEVVYEEGTGLAIRRIDE
jgi:hypothetical protein